MELDTRDDMVRIISKLISMGVEISDEVILSIGESYCNSDINDYELQKKEFLESVKRIVGFG